MADNPQSSSEGRSGGHEGGCWRYGHDFPDAQERDIHHLHHITARDWSLLDFG